MPYIIVRTSRSTGAKTEYTLEAAVRRIIAWGDYRTETTVRRKLLEGTVLETISAFYHLKDETE